MLLPLCKELILFEYTDSFYINSIKDLKSGIIILSYIFHVCIKEISQYSDDSKHNYVS